MSLEHITRALDDEIQRLEQVKQLLHGTRELTPTLRKLVNQAPAKGTRIMSPEGRIRIAEAQKRRWAKAKAL